MFYEEEAYSRGGRYPDRYYDAFHDGMDDGYLRKYDDEDRYCERCGCHIHYKNKKCHCSCHSHTHYHHHHHGKRKCHCRYHCHCNKGCDDDYYPGGGRHVCRDLAWIVKKQRHPYPRKEHCGCTSAIQQLQGSKQKQIIPFMLVTDRGHLYTEWGRSHHYHRSYATVFFSAVKVNCRRNEAILELLKPNKPITNPYTGKVEKWEVKEVDYVIPTGERVYVDLTYIREVRRLSTDFVKRKRHHW